MKENVLKEKIKITNMIHVRPVLLAIPPEFNVFLYKAFDLIVVINIEYKMFDELIECINSRT